MSAFYGPTHRALQDAEGTRRMADRLEAFSAATLSEDDRAFVESVDMLFLSTLDHEGRPTLNYKGGAPGFVRAVAPDEIAFPSYDGNGMFLSLGNIAATGKVGLLFIDFTTARRLRLQGEASAAKEDPLMSAYPGARFILRVRLERVFVNCGRYVHPMSRVRPSPHLPDATGAQPFPAWKRVDLFQEALSEEDAARAAAAGGPIPIEAYPGELEPGKGEG